MVTQAKEFSLFPRLPTEVRLAIWRECLPSRVIELDIPDNELVGKTGTSCQLWHTTSRNKRPPVITRVCRESRRVAFENGFEAERDPDAPGWLAANSSSGILWFTPSTDIIHLNWWTGYCGLYDSTGNPIPFFLWLAAKASGGASIAADLVHPFEDEYTGGYTNEMFALLEGRKDYLVCLKMVSIHVPMDRAIDSGLFGRLGEEPIKVVDALDDEETIRKYQQLWTLASPAPEEDREAAAFFELVATRRLQDRVRRWSEELEKLWLWNKFFQARREQFPGIREPETIWLRPPDDDYDSDDPDPSMGIGPRWTPNRDHPWVKKMLEAMPHFRPMIMFRHCVLKCWLAAGTAEVDG